MSYIVLNQVNKQDLGREFLVHSFIGQEQIVLRLLEMGFHQGDKLKYLGRAPFLGPFIVEIEGTSLALREEEAQCLAMSPL